MLGKVEAVADDELVGHSEADIAARMSAWAGVSLHMSAATVSDAGSPGLQVLQEVLQREP